MSEPTRRINGAYRRTGEKAEGRKRSTGISSRQGGVSVYNLSRFGRSGVASSGLPLDMAKDLRNSSK